MTSRVGLFLGAGASYELGMPLVWHLTAEFKGYYTLDKFREICERAPVGRKIPDEVRDEVLGILARPDLHYENILGFLQTRHRQVHDQQLGREYHRLYLSMVAVINGLLYYRQVRNAAYTDRGMIPFEGLAGLARVHEPLWIFSVNHDLMVELLADRLKIPLKDGFHGDNLLEIPNLGPKGESRTGLTAHVLTEQDLASGRFDFFQRGPGINLLKLHGSLDTFMFRDGKDMCRLVPTGPGGAGIRQSLAIANEDLAYWENGQRVQVLGELTYADRKGELQFLQPTLVAGAQKFTKRYDQTLPVQMLEQFKRHINHVEHLFVIGYSFGDIHIDQIMREWLEFGVNRRLTIVDPGRRDVPNYFRHLAPAVSVESIAASDFFLRFRSRPLSRFEKLERYVRARTRPRLEARAARKHR
ncbi:hypothetical protein [Sorangium sp. So ce1099]|uniref:hypothetical protein n=1 Tax=Sorangium sp. So ce1099 TaxID=3133331 RepID=UPI003F5F5262